MQSFGDESFWGAEKELHGEHKYGPWEAYIIFELGY